LTCNTTNAVRYEVIEGVNVYRLSSWNLVNGSYPVPKICYNNVISLLYLIKNHYSCIITNTRFYPICLIGWAFSRRNSVPSIHLEHGSRHTVSDNPFVSIFGKLYDHSVGTLLVRSAETNLGVSASAVVFLKHMGAKNAKVMHNGIEFSSYQNPEPNTNMEKPGHIIITYVGRLVYAKGVQDLLSILSKLKGNATLFIVGDGPYRCELEALVRYEQISNIIFLGEQLPEKIPGILKRTDIFVNPSYSEGLPTSVLEACAAGCAVIATDVGGTNEIIYDGLTGFLTTPGDRKQLAEKINFLIENKEIRDTLGKNAKAYVLDNFSWDQIIGQWMNEMKQLEEDVIFVQNKSEEMKSDA
jgi:glycosyltransferase involved in cell wall biosynthesis